MNTKFYEFNQNNSGGEFDVDDNVCHRVVIEAKSEDEALSLLEPMIKNQSGSCPCCGERWSLYTNEICLDRWKKQGYKVGVYRHYKDAEERWEKLYGEFPRLVEPKWVTQSWGRKEYEGSIYFNSIEEYCQFMANSYGWTTPDVRIFYLDGRKVEIFKKEIK